MDFVKAQMIYAAYAVEDENYADNGDIGHEHIGYNVGGVSGRSVDYHSSSFDYLFVNDLLSNIVIF